MSRNSFIRMLMLLVCLVGIASSPILAHGAEPVRIGVLAFRPKPQTLAQWRPLAVACKQAIPEYDFVVEAFTYPELEQAVAARQLDFVLTNSGHYVLLKRRSGLSSPLATLAAKEDGRSATVFGGVIFTRAGLDTINTLKEIRGKSVATVAAESLGGFQMQAYELSRAGIDMAHDVTLVSTGMPHDKVIEAVLSGRAEVGFVRSGILESMQREGKLDIKQLKILNQQNLPDFPLRVSTRLYPEWPFAALPHTDENLARHVAAALFLLEDDKVVTQAMGIHGFVVPADYSSVEDLLRELRLPPFDVVPPFTMYDIWVRYRWQIIGAMLALGVIVFLGGRLLLTNRQLAGKQLLLLKQRQELQASEEKFRTVADYTYAWEVWEDPNGSCRYCSPACKRVTGHPPEAFLADPGLLERLIYPEDVPSWKAHHAYVHGDAGEAEGVAGKANELDFRIILPDGKLRWIGHLCYHIHDAAGRDLGHRISNRDITERKHLEAEIAKSRNLEALGFLAGGIAHDFNNLFQALIGNLELAKLETDPSSSASPFLDNAMQVSKSATKLTGQLIAFSPGGTFLPVSIEPTSHIREEALAILEGAEIGVEFVMADNIWSITVDPWRFRTVIKHMVLNAKEAMTNGAGGTLTIVVANKSLPENHGMHPMLPPGKYVRISIQDQGGGISKENLPRIFDPYFSTKERGAEKGMGLGLTLCEMIIRKCGGAIAVDSEVGKGTTFDIYLPASEGEERA